MRKKKRRRGISAGTLAMLLFAGIVLAMSIGFLSFIAGEEMSSRAAELMHRIAQTGQIPEGDLSVPSEESKPYQSASPIPIPTAMPQERTAAARMTTTLTIAAAGTVNAPKIIRDGTVNAEGEYDFEPVFAGLGDVLAQADLAIATLETTTAGEKKGYGSFNAPAQILTALRSRGVDVLALATERALDMGEDGLQITIGEITARGMAYAGARMNGALAQSTNLIGIDGVQIAVLSYTYGLSDEGEAFGRSDAVCLIETERMVQDILQARVDGADIVIVLPHWGTKNKAETPEEVRRLARRLAQAGADIILGTHPNVVQGTERLSVVRADGLEYETVVCYSMGSLLTDARTEENTAGMVARLQITYDHAARRVRLGTLACLPVYVAQYKSGGTYVYRVIDVENAQALDALDESEREAAIRAAQRVRAVTGQRAMEDEGEG